MAFERIEHAGGAIATTLASGITSGDATATLDAATGWPTGSVGQFWIVIDPDLANEEKILCTARSSTTLTGLTRGQDGTTASAHDAGAAVRHIFVATEADEANFAASKTVGQIGAKGDLLVGTGSQTLGVRGAGTNGLPLVARSTETTGVAYELLAAGALASDSVTTAKILNANVTTAKLADDAVTTAKITDLNVTTGKIAADAVTGDKIADDAVDSEHIADGAVDPVHLSFPNAITSVAVTGGPTSGTTELTLGTINIAGQTVGYTLDVAAFWSAYNSVVDDRFALIVYVDGVEKARAVNRHSGSANERRCYSIPCIELVTIPAATACAIVCKVVRADGTGTLTESAAGRMVARAYFGTSTL